MNNPWQYFSQYPAQLLQSLGQSTVVAQQQWLQDCLATNQYSAYGQQYQFALIKNIADYQARVPIVSYENIIPWLDKLQAGQTDQLFTGDVIAFERTGGSYSGGKLIPYSARGLADFRNALLAWLADIVNKYKISKGSVYWALSPATNQPQITKSGIAIGGGDALYLGKENVAAFLALSAVPFSVGQVTDIEDWQLLTLYYLICREDLTIISIWSPSFLIQLIKAITNHQYRLLQLLAKGGVVANHPLAANNKALKCLQAYLEQGETKLLWPDLLLISCWADGASAMQAKQLMDYFPHVHLQPKGLLSTEAVITVPNYQDQLVLSIHSNFYEFLDEQGEIYLAHQLQRAKNYQVIVTTNSGLYRYNTMDIVNCLGYQQDRAILKFIGRAGITSDLVGEKLTESFVNRCLATIKGFAMLAINKQSGGYILLTDKDYLAENKQIVTAIEQGLCNNPQYAYARKLNQLAPLTHKAISEPDKQFLNWQITNGKRLADIKIPALLQGDWQQIFKGGCKQ